MIHPSYQCSLKNPKEAERIMRAVIEGGYSECYGHMASKDAEMIVEKDGKPVTKDIAKAVFGKETDGDSIGYCTAIDFVSVVSYVAGL